MNVDLDKTTEFDCPYCGKSKLTPKKNNDNKFEIINSLDPLYDDEELERYTFAKALECTNVECKKITIVTGRVNAYPYDEFHDKYHMVRTYESTYTPLFFNPPVDIIHIPKCIPNVIQNEIKRSYALFFLDVDSSANILRVAVECFLNEIGIEEKYKNGRKITLHERLKILKRNKNTEVASKLISVKWLGNDGSHYRPNKLSQDTLLKGYEVFLYCMLQYFDNPEEKISKYAIDISNGREI